MNVVRLDDPAAFLEAAAPLLLADEARHNLMLGLAGTAAHSPGLYPDYFAWLVVEDDEPVAAATRTPPHNMVLALPRSYAALDLLVDGIDDDPPGVVGAQPEVERFASAWSTAPVSRHSSGSRRGCTPSSAYSRCRQRLGACGSRRLRTRN